MTSMQRFLGTAWASVHGPVDPHSLMVWALDHGFSGLCLGPGPRALDTSALRRAVGALPGEIAAVRVPGILEPPLALDGSLASTDAGSRATALTKLREAIDRAARLGCARVLLDPGIAAVPGPEGNTDLGDPDLEWPGDRAAAQLARRNAVLDPALDAACRSLFEVLRAYPDVQLCLLPSRHVHGLGHPDSLGHIFEDLGSSRLAYWHDVALAARREEMLGVAQGDWLERFGNRMEGISLGDSSGGSLYLPPGVGGVDYPLLAAYSRRSGRPIPAVIELLPAVDPGEIPGLHAFLNKYGL